VARFLLHIDLLERRPITNFVITPHAGLKLDRRGLDELVIRQVLSNPEQVIGARRGRAVFQSRITFEPLRRVQLVRVFVDVDHDPPEVVTAYRTGKVAKSWLEGA
jgi:hypothetical protein